MHYNGSKASRINRRDLPWLRHSLGAVQTYQRYHKYLTQGQSKNIKDITDILHGGSPKISKISQIFYTGAAHKYQRYHKYFTRGQSKNIKDITDILHGGSPNQHGAGLQGLHRVWHRPRTPNDLLHS